MITSTVPLAFPVPADLDGFWMFDQVHAPRPLTPLSQEVFLGALTEGFCAALKEVGYPLGICFRAVAHPRRISCQPPCFSWTSPALVSARFSHLFAS